MRRARDGFRWISTCAGKDRRQRLVEITDAGREVWRAAIPRWQAAQKHMLDGLGAPAWPRLRDDLDAATEAARQQAEI